MKAIYILKDIGKWFIIGCVFIPFLLIALWITIKGLFVKSDPSPT